MGIRCFLISLLLGILTGLGIGGGNLMMLWLTEFEQMRFTNAKTLNLLCYIPSASTSLFKNKMHNIDLAEIYPGMIVGTVFAYLFSLLSNHWDTNAFQKIFSVVLIYVGIHECFYREEKVK